MCPIFLRRIFKVKKLKMARMYYKYKKEIKTFRKQILFDKAVNSKAFIAAIRQRLEASLA
jgi:hypothetical protein